MTREEAKEVFLNRGFIDGIYDGDKWREACVVISKWLEQEPCEDVISRQDVLDLIADYDLSMGQVVKGIHALPSVTPQEPVIDKIRAEIEQKLGTHGYVSLYNRAIYDVLMIVDKYKAESEDKEWVMKIGL